MRRAVSSKPISLILIVAVATATSGIVYSKSNQDGDSRICLAVPEQRSYSSMAWVKNDRAQLIGHCSAKRTRFADVKKGILVPTVVPGSPADRTGFKQGDVVVIFDGKSVKTINKIIEIIDDKVGKRIQYK